MVKIITVKAEEFAKWQRIKAAAAALDKKSKAMAEAMGLPKAEEYEEGTSGIIQDGNGQPLGKFKAFHFPGATIPPGKRLKIS